MTTKTHIARARITIESTKATIIELLDISALEYNQHQMEVGCQFLRDLYPAKSEINELLELIDQPTIDYSEQYDHYVQLSSFWAWWKMEWYRREFHIIAQVRRGHTLDKNRWYKITSKMATSDDMHNDYYINYLKNFGNDSPIK